jgi:adenylate kinase family enzyme
VKKGSKLGKEVESVLKDGKLISSEQMVRLIQEKIEFNNFGGRYLLDGFPRGQENMDVWEKVMAKWVNLKSVIYFECTEEELKRRLIERGKTSGRSDDNEESIVKRLKVFNDQTKPVVDFYEKQGKLHRFDATRAIAAITADVEKHLDSIGVFPSPH